MNPSSLASQSHASRLNYHGPLGSPAFGLAGFGTITKFNAAVMLILSSLQERAEPLDAAKPNLTPSPNSEPDPKTKWNSDAKTKGKERKGKGNAKSTGKAKAKTEGAIPKLRTKAAGKTAGSR